MVTVQQRRTRWSARAPLGLVVGVSVVAAACGAGGGSGAGDAERSGTAEGGEQAAEGAEEGDGDVAAAADAASVEANPQCDAPSDGVLRIGGLLPETGNQALLGPAQRAGARLAVTEINDAGGVLGRDIEFLPGDSGDTTSDVAQKTVRRHLDAGVDVILGATASSVTLEVIDTVTGSCTIQFSPTSSSAELSSHEDHGLFFRTSPSDRLQGKALAKLVADEGHRSLAVVARQGSYGEGMSEFTRQAFEGDGHTVVANEIYDPEAEGFEAELTAVAEANPDAVAVIGFGESHRILRGLFQRGFTPDKKGIYLVDANVGDALGERFERPGALRGVKGTLPAAEVTNKFRDRLLFADPELQDLVYGPEAYDAVIITALAAVAAGSDDAAAVGRHINGVTRDGEECGGFRKCVQLLGAGKDIDYSGPSGPQELSQAGEPTTASFAVVSYGKNNRIDRARTEYRFASLNATKADE